MATRRNFALSIRIRALVKLCIVGGSGFIGTRLSTLLIEAGHSVAIFDVAPSAAFPDLVTRGDVRDAAAVATAVAGCDAVIHLAAEHRDDVRPPGKYFDVNVGGARNVTAAMAQAGVHRCLLVSSVAVYGLGQHEPSEQSPFAPDSPYGESKVQSETVFRAWQEAGNDRSLVVIRPVVVFGEGNRGNVYNLIQQIRRRRFVMVGRGDNRKSVACVSNLVAFMAGQLSAGPGLRVFNYADKPDLPVRDLVAAIDRHLGRDRQRILAIPRWLGLLAGYAFDVLGTLRGRPFPISSSRIRKFCADTSVATPALEAAGFRATMSIDEGLRRMIASLDHDESASAMATGAAPAARGAHDSQR